MFLVFKVGRNIEIVTRLDQMERYLEATEIH